MELSCTVCTSLADENRVCYANPWERARKRYPCCSEACARAFNPDIHWLPITRPALATDSEQGRLITVARGRLEDGDNPSLVARELLLAGVESARVKKVLGHASIAAKQTHGDARSQTIVGMIFGFITGHFSVTSSRDKRKPDAIAMAFDVLEAWEKRWNP